MPAALLSVAETAALLEIGERAVRKNALAGKYGPLTYEESTRGGGAAGKAIRISLDALPVHYRAKYIEEHGLGEPAAPPPADYDTAPAWARQRACQIRTILSAYEQYLADQDGAKTRLTADFVREWNWSHPEDPVSRTTLLRGQGFTVIETPVNHRERMRGVSKYGVHNRLWRGIRDCFGVRWYLARAVRSNRL